MYDVLSSVCNNVKCFDRFREKKVLKLKDDKIRDMEEQVKQKFQELISQVNNAIKRDAL